MNTIDADRVLHRVFTLNEMASQQPSSVAHNRNPNIAIHSAPVKSVWEEAILSIFHVCILGSNPPSRYIHSQPLRWYRVTSASLSLV